MSGGFSTPAGLLRQRSRESERRTAPGARPSSGCSPLASGPARQRVRVAPMAGSRAQVRRSAGVVLASAASARRRAGVSPMPLHTPTTSARLPDRNPSSSAQSVSFSRAVSARMSRAGSRPRAARPGPWRRPASAANAAGQHHKIRPEPASCGKTSSRRTASSSMKPSAAATLAAALSPTPPLMPGRIGLISCSPVAASPPSPIRESISGAPIVHACCRAWPGAEERFSISSILARR